MCFLQVTNKIVPPDVAGATLGANVTACFSRMLEFIVLVPTTSLNNAEWSARLAKEGSEDVVRALG